MHRLQYLYDVFVRAGDPRYVFTLADLEAYEEPWEFAALVGSLDCDTLDRAQALKSIRPAVGQV